MKLLLDESLSPSQARFPRVEGVDALDAAEAGLSGEPDGRIREYAIATGRVLVTLDGDFANLLRFPTCGTPGVIRLRVHPPTEEAIRLLLRRALHALRGDGAGQLLGGGARRRHPRAKSMRASYLTLSPTERGGLKFTRTCASRLHSACDWTSSRRSSAA